MAEQGTRQDASDCAICHFASSLGERDVHVWVVPLTGDDAQDPRLRDVLSASELTTVARFVSPDDSRDYAASHAAVRRIVAAYTARDPVSIRFECSPTGKPRVAETDVEYSLAHARGLAVVGIGRRKPLGVDVERVRRLRGADALKRACFTPRERAFVEAVGDDEGLLRLWTRKEALVKATGEGVLRTRDPVDVLTASPLPDWRIVDLRPDAGYVGAAVVSDDVARVVSIRGRVGRSHGPGRHGPVLAVHPREDAAPREHRLEDVAIARQHSARASVSEDAPAIG
jgi:4'-phosphopantetheinyl transferase